jgi:hypothetical protein
MNLIQFVNQNHEAIEQGDVVIIGAMRGQPDTGPYGEIFPEVDLTATAYDTRACGIVAELYAELKIEGIQREDEEAADGDSVEASTETADDAADSAEKSGKKSRRANKAEKAVDEETADAASAQIFTTEEFESLDRTRIGPGQRGFMVVLGTYGHCKVDADIAPVKAGDLLTTSPTKGHAQKVLDPAKATGAVIGKALGALKKGKGKIPVLVTLQ